MVALPPGICVQEWIATHALGNVYNLYKLNITIYLENSIIRVKYPL